MSGDNRVGKDTKISFRIPALSHSPCRILLCIQQGKPDIRFAYHGGSLNIIGTSDIY